MGKLRELSEELAKIVDIDEGTAINVETGEIVSTEQIAALNKDMEEIAEHLALIVIEEKAFVDEVASEVKRLLARKKQFENHISGLKHYVQECLQGKKLKTPLVSIYETKTVAVEFDEGFDVYALPSEYQRVKVEADKTEIKNALKAGKTVEGAFLAEHKNLVVK